MASINNEILAATEIMMQRAAQFDDIYSMENIKGLSDYRLLLNRAAFNLKTANDSINPNPGKPLHITNEDRFEYLADTMNLCALAMSIIPTIERGAYEQNGDSQPYTL